MNKFRVLSTLALLTSLVASPMSSQTIRGTVLDDSTSQPIVAAEVSALDSLGTVVAQAITDSSGRFGFAFTPGAYTFRVLRIGYAPTVTTAIQAGASDRDISVVIRVPTASTIGTDEPYALTPVVVEAPPVERYLSAFYRHEAIGMGDQVHREEFESWNPQVLTDVLRRMQGFTILPNPNYMRDLPDGSVDTREYVLDVPGRPHQRRPGQADCPPLIYLDGAYLGSSQRIDINSLPLDAIAAVEAYGRLIETPVEYLRANNECGVIALWTRSGEPGQTTSRFELGIRYGGTVAGGAFVGGRVGVHLVAKFAGPFEFYPALYLISSAFSGHRTRENSSWMAQIALRTAILKKPMQLYVGPGLVLTKPDASYKAVMADVDIDPRYTVLVGTTHELGPTRPFVEVHLLDFLSSSAISAQMFFGMGVQF